MNTHTGGQYTYPTVGGVIPTNLNAYQRQQQPVQPQRTATQQQYAQQTQQQYAQQQYIQQQVQQRTAAANTQQQQTSSNRVAATNKVQPVGQYASSSLSILSSAISAEKNSKKRKAEDNAKVLDSVVPLFNDATNSKSKCDEDEEVINDNEEEQTETASERKVKQLKRELEAVKKDNQSLMERRNNVMKNMIKCHEIYETGLDGIARMNDLRYVPDNVLPDELPDTVPLPSK